MKFLVGTLLWSLAILAVWEKVDIYRTGYSITELQTKRKQAQQEQKVLLVELAKLTSPERIERTAVAQLGMVRPRYDQVVVVKGVPGPGTETPGGRLVRASHTN